MVQKRSTALLALPLAGSLLLAGCSGDAKNKPGSAASTSTTPPSSSTTAPAPTTSTPPPTTTEAVPTIPSAAKQHTKAGAEAFVRFYYDELNRSWSTPTATPLRPFGKSSCRSCAATLETAQELVAKKHHYDGKAATVTNVDAAQDSEQHIYRVLTSVVQESRNVVDESGTVISTDQHKVFTLEVALEPTDVGWLIQSIKRAA